jgi:peptidase M50B-like protein
MIPYPSHLPSPQPDAVARKVLLVSAAVTLALYMIPFGRYLARPLLLLSTLAHEMGHGITALLLGGSFRRLAVWPSGAGMADLDLAGFGRIRQGLTLAGGLVGPSVAAALCFALGKTGQGARWCLLGVGLLLAAAEILVVRNLFGLFFAGVIAAGCLFAGGPARPERLLPRRLPVQEDRRQPVGHLSVRRPADAVRALPAVLALGLRLRRLRGDGPALRAPDLLGAVDAARSGPAGIPSRVYSVGTPRLRRPRGKA